MAAAATTQVALGALINTIITDATADEKTALKPAFTALAAGFSSNPDAVGFQLLVGQFAANAVAAQVTVKGLLLPQIGTLLQTLAASW